MLLLSIILFLSSTLYPMHTQQEDSVGSLVQAVQGASLDEQSVGLDQGDLDNVLIHEDQEGQTADERVILAIKHDSVELLRKYWPDSSRNDLKILIQNGQNTFEVSPLYYAVFLGSRVMLQELVRLGAMTTQDDVNSTGYKILCFAVLHGHAHLLEYLIEHVHGARCEISCPVAGQCSLIQGINPREVSDTQLTTLYHHDVRTSPAIIAIINDYPEVLEELIRLNPHLRYCKTSLLGITPFFSACTGGISGFLAIRCLDVLLKDGGVDLVMNSVSSRNPLAFTADLQKDFVLRYILLHVDTPRKIRQDLFRLLIRRGKQEIIKDFIDNKLDQPSINDSLFFSEGGLLDNPLALAATYAATVLEEGRLAILRDCLRVPNVPIFEAITALFSNQIDRVSASEVLLLFINKLLEMPYDQVMRDNEWETALRFAVSALPSASKGKTPGEKRFYLLVHQLIRDIFTRRGLDPLMEAYSRYNFMKISSLKNTQFGVGQAVGFSLYIQWMEEQQRLEQERAQKFREDEQKKLAEQREKNAAELLADEEMQQTARQHRIQKKKQQKKQIVAQAKGSVGVQPEVSTSSFQPKSSKNQKRKNKKKTTQDVDEASGQFDNVIEMPPPEYIIDDRLTLRGEQVLFDIHVDIPEQPLDQEYQGYLQNFIMAPRVQEAMANPDGHYHAFTPEVPQLFAARGWVAEQRNLSEREINRLFSHSRVLYTKQVSIHMSGSMNNRRGTFEFGFMVPLHVTSRIRPVCYHYFFRPERVRLSGPTFLGHLASA